MKTIGIKLADGSFFPVLEDNHPAQKALELTTAHNNQTKVMVDLYRSKSCSMDDAEYVDSLQIDNLVSHPNGEPSIAFSVSIDENSQLSANIKDPETGHQSETAIPLVTRSEEELLVPDEYDISKIDDSDKTEPDETEEETPETKGGLLSAADKIMENKKKTDLDEPIFGDDALPDFSADTNNIADISHDDMFSTDDFSNEEIPTEEDSSETEIPDFSDIPETEITDNADTIEEPKQDEEPIFDDEAFPDFTEDKTEDSVETPTEDKFPDFSEPEIKEDEDFNYDFEEPTLTNEENSENPSEDENSITDALPDFEEPSTESPENETDDMSENDNLPDFQDSELDNFPTSEEDSEDASSIIDSLPDFDDLDTNSPETEDLSENDNLPDFQDSELDNFPTFNEEPEADITDDELEKSLEESKALNDIFSKDDDDYDFNAPLSTDETDSLEEPFGLPDDFNDFDKDKNSKEEYYGSDFDQFPKKSSPIDDFSLPDFPEDNKSSELPDNFFDDFEDFDSSPSSSAGPLSFTGLYDKETEMGMSGMQNDEITKKTKIPMIICIICALICIIATAFIFLIKPNKTSNKSDITVEKQEEIVLDKNNLPENNQLKVVEETKPLPPPVPEAKEDEIIIIEQAEKVIPKQPEVVKTNLNDISYKVIWGDTLWDIANTYYKNPWKYTDIAKYNGIKNPDHIISGTTLVIPAE